MGVPRQEHGELIAVIESYRSMVVGPPGDKDEQAVVQLPETVSV